MKSDKGDCTSGKGDKDGLEKFFEFSVEVWWEVSSMGEDKSGLEGTLGYKGTRLVLFKLSKQVGVGT